MSVTSPTGAPAGSRISIPSTSDGGERPSRPAVWSSLIVRSFSRVMAAGCRCYGFAAPGDTCRGRLGRWYGRAVDAEAMRRFAVERVEALFNRAELDRVEEFVTPDFVNHEAWPGEDPGYEGFRLRLRRLHDAFPDLHMTVREVLADGDLVAYRAELSGTHR